MINESIKQAREGEEVQIGYLEEKMINGFGPYLYFRYWETLAQLDLRVPFLLALDYEWGAQYKSLSNKYTN